MYPLTEAYETGYLSVGDGHSLYYERHGNPQGEPVVYLHGGPGIGCGYWEASLFDPAHYDVLLFDQRGARRSKPYAAVKANTIENLVEDIEILRRMTGHEKWAVTGGSWGSALAMTYAIRYPERVSRLLLRGIFFANAAGAKYIIEDDGTSRTRYNEWFKAYEDFVPPKKRANGLTEAYYKLLTGWNKAKAVEAAVLFNLWNTSIATKEPRQDLLDAIKATPLNSLSARIFFHYTVHEFNDARKQELLKGMAALPHEVDIIHGRQDHICPVANALELHHVCRRSQLTIVEDCGHNIKEPGLQKAFVAVTDRWASLSL